MYSFCSLEPVCCSMSSSNCCFLTCIQFSEEAGQVVWDSHFFQNFLQFIVIHTIKGFGIVNKAEVDVFMELSCFFDDSVNVGNFISGSSAFSKTHTFYGFKQIYDMYLHHSIIQNSFTALKVLCLLSIHSSLPQYQVISGR